jgi:outer membrane protein
MINRKRSIAAVLTAGLALTASPALAGGEDGNFMVRVLGTVVHPDTDATVSTGGAVLAGADADVSTEVVPALTLTYFLTKNVAVELFCCFARHEVEGEGSLSALGEIADTWIFPPALTLQYHFDRWGSFKPYVGAGLQYINFFSEGTGDNRLGATDVEIDDAVGFTLQAGVDVALGNGWYLNADVKKTWLDTEVTWHNNALLAGADVRADVDIDPWLFSVGLGYRFDLADLFGRRAEAAPLK